jgi:hypothetical protein
MLLSVFRDVYISGGVMYMHPLSLCLLINIGILIYISLSILQKKQFNLNWLEGLKQIGTLAAAWGTFSTIFGLFQAFNALEASPEIIPFQVIMGGMKVAVITVLYGLIIFCFSMSAYIILKLVYKVQPVQIEE